MPRTTELSVRGKMAGVASTARPIGTRPTDRWRSRGWSKRWTAAS